MDDARVRSHSLTLLLLGGSCLLLACSSAVSDKADAGDADAGAGGDAGAGADGAQTVCPNGASPSDADLASCPPELPAPSSCCTAPGLICFYPGQDNTYRQVGHCLSDSGGPTFWQQTLVIDREVCRPQAYTMALGNANAPVCGQRQRVPCTACDCAPDDSLCAARCGGSSGLETPQEELDRDLVSLIQTCGQQPSESTFEVTFASGCATSLAVTMPGPLGSYNLYDSLITCIQQQLDQVHFDCADSLDCAVSTNSTLY